MAAVRRFIARLKSTWKEISEFDDVTADVDTFADLVNKCAPLNELEVTVGDSYRFMYNENRDQFERFITNTHLQHLSLVLDGKLAHDLLKLPDDIVISWNLMRGQFSVYSKSNVPAHQNDTRDSRRVRREFKNNRREQRDIKRGNKKDTRRERRDARRSNKNDTRREQRDNRRDNRVMNAAEYDALLDDVTRVIQSEAVEEVAIVSANNVVFEVDPNKASFRDVLLRSKDDVVVMEKQPTKLTNSWADVDDDTELAPIEGFGTISQ